MNVENTREERPEALSSSAGPRAHFCGPAGRACAPKHQARPVGLRGFLPKQLFAHAEFLHTWSKIVGHLPNSKMGTRCHRTPREPKNTNASNSVPLELVYLLRWILLNFPFAPRLSFKFLLCPACGRGVCKRTWQRYSNSLPCWRAHA